ncbi:NUDIX hydrolase [Aestuariispira insulae]|uniref:NUDIX domain-containing protein n=1 Tax=Aestuariispira insulae TaxID=1461337 RepID=A0A3D9HRL0_9PROT|nr:NUDIX domain-containing protein [Aestuariispira insulae]RED52035.1 NUDIX domain-containing protein [Aestuariispira insulae]
MSYWRPKEMISMKVLGLVMRGDALLAMEVPDDDGRLKGVRPPGGSIEFGESREQALHREFQEEFGCRISIDGPWKVVENIYDHHGAAGHEYLFIAPVTLLEAGLYHQDRFDIPGEGQASWFSRKDFTDGGIALFPEVLLPELSEG